MKKLVVNENNVDKDYLAALKKITDVRKKRKDVYGNSWKTTFIENFYQIKNKFERLKMMIDNNAIKNSYETAEDTLIDLCNYSLFALHLLDNEVNLK